MSKINTAEYHEMFSTSLRLIPKSFHSLIDTEWMKTVKNWPMQFYHYMDLPMGARDFVEDAIRDAESMEHVKLISTNYVGGLCLLSLWPGQESSRLNIHPEDKNRFEYRTRKYSVNRDIFSFLCIPMVIWVKSTVIQNENWWRYRVLSELRIF